MTAGGAVGTPVLYTHHQFSVDRRRPHAAPLADDVVAMHDNGTADYNFS